MVLLKGSIALILPVFLPTIQIIHFSNWCKNLVPKGACKACKTMRSYETINVAFSFAEWGTKASRFQLTDSVHIDANKIYLQVSQHQCCPNKFTSKKSDCGTRSDFCSSFYNFRSLIHNIGVLWHRLGIVLEQFRLLNPGIELNPLRTRHICMNYELF